MTAFFGLLAVIGAAGLIASLYGKSRAASGFAEALNAAESAGPEADGRLEAVEARLTELERLVRSLAAAELGRRAAGGKAPPERRQGAVPERSKTVWSAYRDSGDPLATARALGRGMAEVELALKMNRLRGLGADDVL